MDAKSDIKLKAEDIVCGVMIECAWLERVFTVKRKCITGKFKTLKWYECDELKVLEDEVLSKVQEIMEQRGMEDINESSEYDMVEWKEDVFRAASIRCGICDRTLTLYTESFSDEVQQ